MPETEWRVITVPEGCIGVEQQSDNFIIHEAGAKFRPFPDYDFSILHDGESTDGYPYYKVEEDHERVPARERAVAYSVTNRGGKAIVCVACSGSWEAMIGG